MSTRVAAVFVAGALAFSLSGCGGDDSVPAIVEDQFNLIKVCVQLDEVAPLPSTPTAADGRAAAREVDVAQARRVDDAGQQVEDASIKKASADLLAATEAKDYGRAGAAILALDRQCDEAKASR